MAKDVRLIHDAEQLTQWLKDMAHALGVYRAQLLADDFPPAQVDMMVQRMESEIFGYWMEDDDGVEWTEP